MEVIPAGPHDSIVHRKTEPVDDFATFMMFFNDTFVQDEYFIDFGLTNQIFTSNIIGSGGQFEVKLYKLDSQVAFRTSSGPPRITEGHIIVLKRPRIMPKKEYLMKFMEFAERQAINAIVREWRVISLPGVREHKNILDVYGFAWEIEKESYTGSTSVWPVILVEYGELGTFDEFLAASDGLDFNTKLNLSSDIGRGLAALHSCGIAHSDLKPDNILVCRHENGKPIAKLSDFGLCHFVYETETPSKWETGVAIWSSPEWGTVCTSKQILQADKYSCGLLLWKTLLNGSNPWELQVFEYAQSKFQFAKRDKGRMTETAIKSTATSQELSETQLETISSLFQSLLCRMEDRSLDLLLQLPDGVSAVNNNTDLKPYRPIEEPTPIFSQFSVLQDLPLAVQHQLIMSLSSSASNDRLGQLRRAEAAYAVAIALLLRIGTVHPVHGTSEYNGYNIDSNKVMHWLRTAAELGSPSAQATFYSISQALITLGSDSDSNFKPEEDSIPNISTVISWLRTATSLGSSVASKWLRKLNYDAWKDARRVFKTEYCGLGRNLFEGISLSSLDNSSIFTRVTNSGDRILHFAATQGRMDIIKRSCTGISSTELNAQNERGETALFQACRSGHQQIVRCLISAGANAGVCSGNGESVLHWLCAFDEPEAEILELASLMIKAGANIEQECSENTLFNSHFRECTNSGTPLCRMVQQDSLIAAKALIKLGATPYNGTEPGFAMMEACLSHDSDFIQIFLESDHLMHQPRWYGTPGLFTDIEDAWELMQAALTNAPFGTFQAAAPGLWESLKKGGTEPTLLGFTLRPYALHTRMALHGAAYSKEMSSTISLVASLESQDFSRVSWDNQSALSYAITSRDEQLVNYLLSISPDDSHVALTNPAPSGNGVRLPIHQAARIRHRPIFDILLHQAGPTARVGTTKIPGIPDSWQDILRFGQLLCSPDIPTITTTRVSTSITNLIHLIVATNPDPHFIERVLRELPSVEAKELVNSHGHFDEVPLTVAIQRGFYDVAKVLLKYGAKIEEEGTYSDGTKGFPMSPLGAIISFNNHSSAASVEWLLRYNPSLFINKATSVTAFEIAIRSGSVFETSTSSQSIPIRIYEHDNSVLELLVKHFTKTNPGCLDYLPKYGRGITALQWAVMRLNRRAVEMLLMAGADPNLGLQFSDTESMSALSFVMSLDRSDVPSEAQARGPKEVDRYLNRFRDLRQAFENFRAISEGPKLPQLATVAKHHAEPESPDRSPISPRDAVHFQKTLERAVSPQEQPNLTETNTATTDRTPSWKQPLYNNRSVRALFLSRLLPWIRKYLRPNVKPGFLRVEWKCYCGRDLYADIPGSQRKNFDNLVLSLPCSESSSSNQVHNDFPAAQNASVPKRTQNAAHGISDKIINSGGGSISQERQFMPGSGVYSPVVAARRRFLALCVNTGGMYKTLAEIEMSDATSDATGFLMMKKEYLKTRGYLSRFHFLIKPITVEFVKFRLWNRKAGYLSICNRPDCIPPHDSSDYDYKPNLQEGFPPMPPEVFIHYLEHNEADLSPMQNDWIPRLPKRLGNRVIECERICFGWGLHIIEGPNREVIFWIMVLALLISILVSVLWSALQHNIQEGFALGALIVALPSTILTAFLFRLDRI